MKKLVIVESPSKSKTIKTYLGEDYEVLSSKGHVRDLAISKEGGLGIDIKNEYKPEYVIIDEKKKLVEDLKKACKGKETFLATDPDREGEAISWHLGEILGLDMSKANRVVFNEITHDAVLEGISHPRQIDMSLVSSQETRRILDRIIGFKLSKLLQSKIGSKSAGRVQSVALKLIVDLEKEIQAFVPTEYYTIQTKFPNFTAELICSSEKESTYEITPQAKAEEIYQTIGKDYKVETVEFRKWNKDSKGPYITSTLQQDASNKLNFNSTKTMKLAQSLYEGKELSNGTVGLITYMRTDSERMSDEFVTSCYQYIESTYGKKYKGKIKNKKHNLSQDAHEAIRPTSIKRTPESVKDYLTKDELKLYTLIFNRTVASLMASAQYQTQKIILSNQGFYFKATETKKEFLGYQVLYNDDEEQKNEKFLEITENTVLSSAKKDLQQHFTKPKARYTEASLIKDMEEKGIGRPSTYAQTLKTLKDREYVLVKEKHFIPTEQGILSIQKLEEFFASIVNVDFTANMERQLDGIAEGTVESVQTIDHFYRFFMPLVKEAEKNMEKKAPELLEELCPNCGSPLVVRKGKYGSFTACSNYPKCKFIKKEEKEIIYHPTLKCEKCGGALIQRMAKKGKNKGKIFFACSNYPKCDYILNDTEINNKK